MGSYVIAFEEEAGSVRDVEITEVDIDNFIRAKGAIFSAIRTMLNYLDMDVSMIEEVYVAGGKMCIRDRAMYVLLHQSVSDFAVLFHGWMQKLPTSWIRTDLARLSQKKK